jgi:hypothetical protein
MSTCSAHHQVTNSAHPLNRGLKVYYWGLVPWVPWVVGYAPKFWIRPVPSSSTWLGNPAPHTRNSATTPGWRGGSTNLKRLTPGVIQTFAFPPYDRSERAGFRHLFAGPTSLDLGQGPGLRSNMPGSFWEWISIVKLEALEGGGLRLQAWWDVATGAQACLTGCTQVLESIPSPLGTTARPRIHT